MIHFEYFQMSVRMSKLEFFCNRPTLVALIGFGLDISSVHYAATSSDTETISEDKSVVNKEKTEESGRVKGLLGYGKNRVVFYLNMDVDSVSVFLNKEDDSPLAMLVQERFLLDLKVLKSCSIFFKYFIYLFIYFKPLSFSYYQLLSCLFIIFNFVECKFHL